MKRGMSETPISHPTSDNWPSHYCASRGAKETAVSRVLVRENYRAFVAGKTDLCPRSQEKISLFARKSTLVRKNQGPRMVRQTTGISFAYRFDVAHLRSP